MNQREQNIYFLGDVKRCARQRCIIRNLAIISREDLLSDVDCINWSKLGRPKEVDNRFDNRSTRWYVIAIFQNRPVTS